MVLAFLGGHRRVLDWERRLGISQVITAGFPFVLLGMLARNGSVGILSDGVLAEISPLLRLGLGWIGFVAGIRFDTRMLQGLPARTLRIVALTTLFPLRFWSEPARPSCISSWSNRSAWLTRYSCATRSSSARRAR